MEPNGGGLCQTSTVKSSEKVSRGCSSFLSCLVMVSENAQPGRVDFSGELAIVQGSQPGSHLLTLFFRGPFPKKAVYPEVALSVRPTIDTLVDEFLPLLFVEIGVSHLLNSPSICDGQKLKLGATGSPSDCEGTGVASRLLPEPCWPPSRRTVGLPRKRKRLGQRPTWRLLPYTFDEALERGSSVFRSGRSWVTFLTTLL